MDCNKLTYRVEHLSRVDKERLLSQVCGKKQGYDDSLLLMIRSLLDGQVDTGYWDSFARLVPELLRDNEIQAYADNITDSDLVCVLFGDLNWALTHWGNRVVSLPSFIAGLSTFAWGFLEVDMDVLPMVYLNKMFGDDHWDVIMEDLRSVYTDDYIYSRLAEGILNIGMCTNVSWLMGLAHGDPCVLDSKGNAGQFSVLTGRTFTSLPDYANRTAVFHGAVQEALNMLGDVTYTGNSWRKYCGKVATYVNDAKVRDMKDSIDRLRQYAQSEYERLMCRPGIGKLAVLTPAQVMASIFGADVVIK